MFTTGQTEARKLQREPVPTDHRRRRPLGRILAPQEPDFFTGTVVEKAAAEVLVRT
jgi:hypothetical protein